MIATFSSVDKLEPAGHTRRPVRFTKPVNKASHHDTSITAITTFVLWLGCTGIGVAGLLLPYTRPQPPKVIPSSMQFEKFQVELTSVPLPQPGLSSPPHDLASPPPVAALAQPNIPQPVSVAELSAIAFAVPVEGLVQVVDATQGGLTRNANTSAAVAGSRGPVQSLVFGRGEGRQPAPTYPPRAAQLGQEGVVSVQFTVDESGHVIAAEASQPSPWPLLTDAAVRTVRERWRFAAGALRNFEVAIHFHLKK